MPCHDYSEEERREQLRQRLDKVTAMLCRVCRIIQNSRHWLQMDSEIVAWYEQHMKEDAERLRKETQDQIRQMDFLNREIERLKKEKKALEDK